MSLSSLPLELITFEVGRYIPVWDCSILSRVSRTMRAYVEVILEGRAQELSLNYGCKVNFSFFRKCFHIINFLRFSDEPTKRALFILDFVETILKGNHFGLLTRLFSGELNCPEARGRVKISSADLSYIFSKSFQLTQGTECLKVVVQDSRFQEVSQSRIQAVFQRFWETGQVENFKILLEKIDARHLNQTLMILESKPGSYLMSCVPQLVRQGRLKDLNPLAQNMIFLKLAEKGDASTLGDFMRSDCFDKLPMDIFGQAFVIAAQHGSLDCLKEMIECRRFIEIEKKYLQLGFEQADDEECQESIRLAARRFSMDLGKSQSFSITPRWVAAAVVVGAAGYMAYSFFKKRRR